MFLIANELSKYLKACLYMPRASVRHPVKQCNFAFKFSLNSYKVNSCKNALKMCSNKR